MTQATPPPSAPAKGGPDYRDLYILVAAIALGLLLGPGVLGRLAPATYDRWFIGGQVAQQALTQKEREFESGRQALAMTGASSNALVEYEQNLRPQLAVMQAGLQQARADHATRLGGVLASLVLALALVMVGESLVDPGADRVRARLTSGRYIILGLWIALALARPALLRPASPVVVAVVVAGVLLLMLLPGPRPNPSKNDA